MTTQSHAPRATVRKVLLMAAILAAASALGYLFRHYGFSDTSTVVVHLLSVLVAAWLTRSFAYGFLASLIAAFSFNYFFAEPRASFYVNDPNYIVIFLTMIVTAFITSALTSRVKRSALSAQERGAEVRALSSLIAVQRAKSSEEIGRERYRANLLRAISHDLRTPLSGIIGTSEMIMSMTDRGDPRYDLAGGIRKDADWLHSLVENILNLTRLQDGNLPITKRLEAVEEVIGSAVNQVARRSPNYDIAVSAPDELLLVPMDARLIEQVIINLLDNAIKHTGPGGEISISARLDRGADRAVFVVRDGGTGINEADLPNLFRLFYTADAGRAHAGYGFGLGLAICETVVLAHGGSIEAHNRTDGQGAEFTFALPMEDKNSE